MAIWDINKLSCIYKQNVNAGQISKILFHTDGMDNNVIITAGINDGAITCIDMRSHEKIINKRVYF